MTATEKIEKIIETRKILKSQTENPVSETYIDMFIKDLESLQEPTEEREVTLKISDLEWFEYEWCYCKCWRIIA